MTDAETFVVWGDPQNRLVRVRRPTEADLRESELAYQDAYRAAQKFGTPTKARLDVLARERGLWNDDFQRQYDGITNALVDDEELLGRIPMEQGRQIAVRMRANRAEASRLKQDVRDFSRWTVEDLASRGRWDFLVATCTSYVDTGEAVFLSGRDFRRQAKEKVGRLASAAFARLALGRVPDEVADVSPPEELFLRSGRRPPRVASA